MKVESLLTSSVNNDNGIDNMLYESIIMAAIIEMRVLLQPLVRLLQFGLFFWTTGFLLFSVHIIHLKYYTKPYTMLKCCVLLCIR